MLSVMFTIPDLINGLFELLGGFFIALSVMKIHRQKKASGIHWGHMAFFTGWGFWNLFYYPSLEQWASFTGGLFLVLVNCVYLAQVIYYSRHPHDEPKFGDEAYQPPDYFGHYIIEFNMSDSDMWSPLDFGHMRLASAKQRAATHAAGCKVDASMLKWQRGKDDKNGPVLYAYGPCNGFRWRIRR